MSEKLDGLVVAKAVNALLAYEEKKSSQEKNGKSILMAGYSKPILAQIQLTKEISKAVVKPTRVKIPNSLFSASEEDHTVCLFCRSDDKEAIEQYFSNNPFTGLSNIISISQMKKNYARFQDKKSLLAAHTHFVCDSRIAQQLYNLLGSTFSARNNLPVQLNFTEPEQLPGQIQKALDSTYFHMAGKAITIRFGHTAMEPKLVLANILEGLPFAVAKLQNEWKDVMNIHLKTSDSAALPIYSKLPDDMAEYVKKQMALPTNTPAKTSTITNTPKSKKRSATATDNSTTPSTKNVVVETTTNEHKSAKKQKVSSIVHSDVDSVVSLNSKSSASTATTPKKVSTATTTPKKVAATTPKTASRRAAAGK